MSDQYRMRENQQFTQNADQRGDVPIPKPIPKLRYFLGLLGLFPLLGCQPTFAQLPVIPGFVEQIPKRVQQLIQGPLPPPTSSASQPSQQGLTLPSLWWVDRLYGEKLVLDWLAYGPNNGHAQQVQVIVRPNLWTRFSYVERYAFVTHFGAITRTYGYQMVMIDTRGYPMASYLCNFDQATPQIISGVRDFQNNPIPDFSSQLSPKLDCEIWLNSAFPRNFL